MITLLCAMFGLALIFSAIAVTHRAVSVVLGHPVASPDLFLYLGHDLIIPNMKKYYEAI
jgi:hypothetical protein